MSKLTFLALGGMGRVTQNMYVYEYQDEMVLIDCGIGFPDTFMPGVDVLIPDIEYLLRRIEQGKHIVGMILSHGHDDHIAATPYLLPHLPEFPIYASPLTAGFAQQRMADGKLERTVNVIDSPKPFTLGTHFSAQLFPVTHSVPDTRHIALHTPEGVIYHGSDFKLDPTPIDGVVTDFENIRALAKEQQILCMLIDCLRVENSERVQSESTTGPAIASTMEGVHGKYVMTLMSSHIHRIQQTVDAAVAHHRKVAFIGRSVERNVEIALNLGKLVIPPGTQIDKRDTDQYRDNELCLIVAGSQGQEGSSLMRAVYGEHPILQIKPQDKVVFSADAIPGNELSYFGAIDELARNGIEVVYPSIMPNLHQSGHASAPEQQEIVGLVKPRYVLPIGGADRHRALFVKRVAQPLGFANSNVLLPQSGEVLGFEHNSVSVVERVTLKPQIVDGLGIGDVGPVVLSDRQILGQAGMVVVVIPRHQGRFQLEAISVVSRGFVFMKEADEVVEFIKDIARAVIQDKKTASDIDLTKVIEKRLSRKLYEAIQREPKIVAIILDL